MDYCKSCLINTLIYQLSIMEINPLDINRFRIGMVRISKINENHIDRIHGTSLSTDIFRIGLHIYNNIIIMKIWKY